MSASIRTNELTQKEAQEWFFYDSDTGRLHWKMKPCKRVALGAEAGCLNNNRYLRIQLQGKNYQAHNIVWNIHYGIIPDDMTVDHVDKDKSNNRIDNLRLANNRQQSINQNVRGFSWRTSAQSWIAMHKVAGRHKYLGDFTTALQARLAYERGSFESEPEFASTWLTDAVKDLCSDPPTAWRPSAA